MLTWCPKGKLLAVSRHDDWTKFTLPGGKVDAKDRVGSRLETLRRAARRELNEETGLDADVLEPVFADYDHGEREAPHARQHPHYTTVLWAAECPGSIWTTEPHVVQWASPSVILDGPFGPFYARMFASLLER